MYKALLFYVLVTVFATAGIAGCAALAATIIGLVTPPVWALVGSMLIAVFFSLFGSRLRLPFYASLFLMHQRPIDAIGHAIAAAIGTWTGTFLVSFLTGITGIFCGALAALVVGGVIGYLLARYVVQKVFPYRRG